MAKQRNQIIECGTIINRYVVYLINGLFAAQGSPYIYLHHIINKAKITTGPAVAIDLHRLLLDDGRYPLGDHRRIGTIGVLTLPKHIKITQTNTGYLISTGKTSAYNSFTYLVTA